MRWPRPRWPERRWRALDAWDDFWFAPDRRYTLSLFRLLFGATFVLKLTGSTGLFRLHDLSVSLPKRGVLQVAAALEGFHVPYPWLTWLPVPSAFWFARIEEALLVLAVMLTVGLFTRVVAPALALLYTYVFFLSQLNFYHHLYFFLLVSWVFAFTDCGRHYSLDALLGRRVVHREPTTRMPVRLVQVLVCTIYLFTFVWKVKAGWLDGSAMQSFVDAGSLRGPVAPWVVSAIGPRALGAFALAVEGFMPIGLLVPRLRRLAILCGIVLHVGIDLMMHVNTFSYQMLASYALFLYPIPGATVVLYDGGRVTCRRARTWVRLLDWLGRVSWLDYRCAAVRSLMPELTVGVLARRIHVFTPDGRVLEGYRGWCFLLGCLPLTFAPSFLLHVPPVAWFGRRVHERIAEHRQRACEPASEAVRPLPPTPWRSTLRSAFPR